MLKIHKIPRTLDELGTLFDVPKKIKKCYNTLVKEFSLRIRPPSPMEFISRFQKELGLSPNLIGDTEVNYREIRKLKITQGNNPLTLAAAIMYFTARQAGEKLTQNRIIDVMGVSEATLRTRCKEISRLLS